MYIIELAYSNERLVKGVVSVMRYVCSICGYVYDEARNQPRETLPNNWKCPPLRRGQGGFSARRHTVTRMLQSLLTRYTREDEAILKDTGVWVRTISGFGIPTPAGEG